jgi:hypothetical protein
VFLPGERVLVVGYSHVGVAGSTDENFALAHYHNDGSLDPDFGGGDGVHITDISAIENGDSHNQERALSVSVMSDGRFVVGGYYQFSADSRMALARYESTPQPQVSPDAFYFIPLVRN